MKTSKIKAVVVDDEDVLREGLVEILQESSRFLVVGEASSKTEAIEVVNQTNPDVLFLDVQLKGGNAFDVLEGLYNIPKIVLNTAHPEFEYAQKAHNEYKDHIILIIKKPFWKKWDLYCAKIIKYFDSHTSNKGNSLMIKSRYLTQITDYKDIIFIESDSSKKGKGCLKIFSKDEHIEMHDSLNNISELLPNNFIRISRYAIVNKDCIKSYDHTEQMLSMRYINRQLGVGNSYKNNVLNYFESLM